jgi:beta-glucosidase
MHAPGVADLPSAFRAAHHLLLGHGLAAEAVRSTMAPAARLGVTLNLSPSRPASGSVADAEAAVRVDGYANRWFLDPIFRGEYPKDLAGLVRGAAGDAHLRPGDLETINAPIDFLGVNYYYCHTVAAAGGAPHPGDRPFPALLEAVERPDPAGPVTGRRWPVQPEGLTELLARLDREYAHLPLYVTENGAAFPDYVGPDGAVKDPERVDYLESHLKAAHDAIGAGVDLRGYFCWTLIDNFEWADGYSQRFGLVWVDFKTQERIPKSSAWWFAGVASRNSLIPGARP